MSKLKSIIEPVVEELGKFGETAKKQVSPDNEKKDEQKTKDETAKLVKDIYKPQGENTPEELLQKQAEDKKKEQQIRNALHQSTYYQPLINRPKKQEEVERPQERVERQEKEDRWKLEEKKKKEEPIAVQHAAQKAEKYPGASG